MHLLMQSGSGRLRLPPGGSLLLMPPVTPMSQAALLEVWRVQHLLSQRMRRTCLRDTRRRG